MGRADRTARVLALVATLGVAAPGSVAQVRAPEVSRPTVPGGLRPGGPGPTRLPGPLPTGPDLKPPGSAPQIDTTRPAAAQPRAEGGAGGSGEGASGEGATGEVVTQGEAVGSGLTPDQLQAEADAAFDALAQSLPVLDKRRAALGDPP